jgi:uncharacterized membrane protein YfhO
MTKTFATWISFLIANAAIGFWLINLGVPVWVIENDFTFLSVIIFFLYVGSVISLWWESVVNRTPEERFSVQWFIAQHLTVVGLLGTVIGLMTGVAVLSEQSNIDPNDIESITTVLTSLFLSLSTALVTTIVGIVASLLLKVQLLIINSVHKNETEQG